MTFSEKLQQLRKERHLSREALAEAIGVSRQSISKWEIGSAKPDVDKLLLLSEYLQVSTDYLLKDRLEEDPWLSMGNPENDSSMPEDKSKSGPLLQQEPLSCQMSSPTPADEVSAGSAAQTSHGSKAGRFLDNLGFFCWLFAILFCLFIVFSSGAAIQEILILLLIFLLIAAPIWFITWVVRQLTRHTDSQK